MNKTSYILSILWKKRQENIKRECKKTKILVNARVTEIKNVGTFKKVNN